MTHTADSSGQQTRPPGTTIDAGEIEKARAIVTNLDKVGSKRKLNPNEQQAYDRARGLLERESPAQTGTRDGSQRSGDRNTENPKELVMAGDGPVAQGHGAAAAPPPAAAVQPADAIGATIEGAGTANPDAPKATAAAPGGATPPISTSTAGVSASSSASSSNASNQPAAASGSATAAAAGSNSAGTSSHAASSTTGSHETGNTPTPSYPPIDHDHIIKADFNSSGKPTGGHSLVNGDVEIIAGIESWPNAHGVYEAHVHMKNANGQWITKESNQGVNTMFPKNWSASKIKEEVEAAWNSSSKVISPDGKSWRSTTPSGVVIHGYINHNRITAYPVY